ncbi:lysine transporter LysE, partial [Klebsiella michiganensis]
PKAWIACASGVALFSDSSTHTMLITFIIIYFSVCYISLTAWAILGNKVSTLLSSAQRIRVFNVLMGGLLIMTACYMLSFQ